MFKSFISLCLLLISFFIFIIRVDADVVYLKDGQYVVGEILLTNDVFIRMKPVDRSAGSIREFLWSQIKSVEKGTYTPNEAKLARDIEPVVRDEEPKVAPVKPEMAGAVEAPVLSEPEVNVDPNLLNMDEASQLANLLITQHQQATDAAIRKKEAEAKNNAAQQKQVLTLSSPMHISDADLQGLNGDLSADRDVLAQDLTEEEIENVMREVQPYDANQILVDALKQFGYKFLTIFVIIILVVIWVAKLLIARFVDRDAEKSSDRAGLFLRGLAYMIDTTLMTFAVMFVTFVGGFFLPLDDGVLTVALPMGLVMIVFMNWYLYLGYTALPNTFGRYVMGIKVCDADENIRPTIVQGLKRTFSFCLWPIDLFLITFSKTRKRIGDRWAGTVVLKYQSGQHWSLRLMVLGLVIALVGVFFYKGIPVITGKMLITKEARAYLSRRGIKVNEPSQVVVSNQNGWVTFKTESAAYGVELDYNGRQWRGVSSRLLQNFEVGFGLFAY